MDRDTPSPDPATPPTALWRRAAGIGGRGLLWLPGTLLGALLAGCAALWLWAGTEGSLALMNDRKITCLFVVNPVAQPFHLGSAANLLSINSDVE